MLISATRLAKSFTQNTKNQYLSRKPEIRSLQRQYRGFLLLRITLGVSLLLFLIARLDASTFLASLKQADILSFAIALVISALAVLIRSYKWRLLLRVQGTELSLSRLHSLNYMAMFFNNFFLGSFGGDTFRIYRTANSSNSTIGALSPIIVEKLANILALILLAMTFGIVCLNIKSPAIAAADVYRIFAFTIVFFSLVYALFQLVLHMRNAASRRKSKIQDVACRFIDSVLLYRDDAKTIIVSLILSVIFYLTNVVAMHFFALAGNVQISPVHLSFIVPMVFLIVMIPISVNGLGLQEGTFFFYFNLLGIDSSSALLVALLPRIGMLIFSLIGALLYITESMRTSRLKDYETLN
jgi:glycosyltransferase 2 family protein